jgi:hypothetical protein
MRAPPTLPILKQLRERIQHLDGGATRHRTVLPFRINAINAPPPGNGPALGAPHEVVGHGNGAINGAAAEPFTATIAVRTRGQVLRYVRRQDHADVAQVHEYVRVLSRTLLEVRHNVGEPDQPIGQFNHYAITLGVF